MAAASSRIHRRHDLRLARTHRRPGRGQGVARGSMAVIACSARLEPTARRHRLRLTLAREWRGRVPPAYDEMLRNVRLALPVADQ
eukprot:scaffold28806_cov54-Phaeocystis_antarctica.AAC.1